MSQVKVENDNNFIILNFKMWLCLVKKKLNVITQV